MAHESQLEARHSQPQGREAWAGLSRGQGPLSLRVCAHRVQRGEWQVNLGALPTFPHLSRTPGREGS